VSDSETKADPAWAKDVPATWRRITLGPRRPEYVIPDRRAEGTLPSTTN